MTKAKMCHSTRPKGQREVIDFKEVLEGLSHCDITRLAVPKKEVEVLIDRHWYKEQSKQEETKEERLSKSWKGMSAFSLLRSLRRAWLITALICQSQTVKDLSSWVTVGMSWASGTVVAIWKVRSPTYNYFHFVFVQIKTIWLHPWSYGSKPEWECGW